MQDDGSSCIICYDPLSVKTFGTTVPCGHLFHEDCFSGWSGSKESRDVKCPMCNGMCERGRPFMRIFCDLKSAPTADEDGGSSSDDEGDEDDASVSSPLVDFNDVNGNTAEISDSVIEILDDDDELAGQAVATMTKKKASSKTAKDKSNDTSTSSKKYKQKAKRLKRKCKFLEKQRIEMVTTEAKRSKEHKDLKEKMRTFDADMVQIEELNRVNHLELQEYKLELRRCKTQLDRYKSEAEHYKIQANKVSDSLQMIQASHTKQLQAAQSTSLTEVRELQTQHREMSIENQRLKEVVSQRNIQIVNLQRRTKRLTQQVNGLADASMETFELDRRKNQKMHAKEVRRFQEEEEEEENFNSAGEVASNESRENEIRAIQKLHAKELRRFQEEKRLEIANDAARDERRRLQKRMSSKSSASAARIGRASEKRISKASSVLDDICIKESTAKRKRQVEPEHFTSKKPSIQITRKKPEVRAARAEAFAKFTRTKKHSSMMQNDIRTMWSLHSKR